MNLTPRTAGKRAADLRVGDVVLESSEHPARIVRLTYTSSRVHVYCRYIWQATREPAWKLGEYRAEARLETAKRGEY